MSEFEILEPNDVITVEASTTLSFGHPTFRVSEITQHLVRGYCKSEVDKTWALEGYPAEVLSLKASCWRKGKVCVTIEFCPDDPPGTDSEDQQGSDV